MQVRLNCVEQGRDDSDMQHPAGLSCKVPQTVVISYPLFVSTDAPSGEYIRRALLSLPKLLLGTRTLRGCIEHG